MTFKVQINFQKSDLRKCLAGTYAFHAFEHLAELGKVGIAQVISDFCDTVLSTAEATIGLVHAGVVVKSIDRHAEQRFEIPLEFRDAHPMMLGELGDRSLLLEIG